MKQTAVAILLTSFLSSSAFSLTTQKSVLIPVSGSSPLKDCVIKQVQARVDAEGIVFGNAQTTSQPSVAVVTIVALNVNGSGLNQTDSVVLKTADTMGWSTVLLPATSESPRDSGISAMSVEPIANVMNSSGSKITDLDLSSCAL